MFCFRKSETNVFKDQADERCFGSGKSLRQHSRSKYEPGQELLQVGGINPF